MKLRKLIKRAGGWEIVNPEGAVAKKQRRLAYPEQRALWPHVLVNWRDMRARGVMRSSRFM